MLLMGRKKQPWKFGAILAKQNIASGTYLAANKEAFADETVTLPADDDIIRDHQALAYVNGIIKVPDDARYKGADGLDRHGDSAIAGMLAWFASRQQIIEYEYESARAGSEERSQRRERLPDHDLQPDKALNALMAIAGTLANEAAIAPSSVDQAMLIASAVHNWATALKLSTEVDHEVRDSALKLRQAISDSADLFEPVLSALSATAHVAVSSRLAQLVAALNAAAYADINEAIGRLPRVIRLTLERDTDAFLIASHFYGDALHLVEEGYQALIARNRPRHPAQLPAGSLEVLS